MSVSAGLPGWRRKAGGLSRGLGLPVLGCEKRTWEPVVVDVEPLLLELLLTREMAAAGKAGRWGGAGG